MQRNWQDGGLDTPSTALNSITNTTAPKKARVVPPKDIPVGEGKAGTLVLAKPRRWKGAFKNLLQQIPLDVLYDIFALLHPRDLLSLSRSTKLFRQYLLKKSSSWIWKNSLENNGLSSTPEGMSEPAYASWMFDYFCNSCLATKAYYKHMQLCIRFCKKCIPKIFTTEHKGIDRILQMKRDLFDSFDGEYESEDDDDDDGPVPDEIYLKVLLPYFDSPGRKSKTLYHKPSCDRIISLIDELLASLPHGVEEWVENRITEHDNRTNLESSNLTAFRNLAKTEGNEEKDLRKERRDMIITKLTELGWAEELEKVKSSDAFIKDSDVNKAKPLTERAWKSIQPHMINLMERLRTRRLNEERSEVIKGRLSVLESLRQIVIESNGLTSDQAYSCPTVNHLLTIKTIGPIVMDAPFDKVLKGSSRKIFAFKSVFKSIEEWRIATMEGFLNMLKAHPTKSDSPLPPKLEDLDSPTTIFQCTGCKDFLDHPGAVSHCCRTNLPPEYGSEKGMQLKWPLPPPINIPFDAYLSAVTILKQCGDLALKVKQEDAACINPLDERKLYFECLSCRRDDTRMVMGWFEAVKHNLSSHEFKGQWSLLSGKEALSARRYEIADLKFINPWKVKFLCTHCPSQEPRMLREMYPHLALQHAIFHDPPRAVDARVAPEFGSERSFEAMSLTNTFLCS